jgi:hypothetical protein
MTPSVGGLLYLLLGLWVGYGFADWDQRTPLLIHRSILTHGFLVPLLLFGFVASLPPRVLMTAKFLPVGFALATAVHLCFDLFPGAWYGFALIHIPLIGRTSAVFSFLWILASIILCAFIAWRYVSGRGELGVALMATAAVAALTTTTHLRTAIPALGVLLVVTAVTLPGRHRQALLRQEAV